MTVQVLVVNFGATSTKVAVYQDNIEKFSETISHPKQEIQQFSNAKEQKEYRKNKIKDLLARQDIEIETIDAVATRGGILPPVNPGAYEINKEMMDYQLNFDQFDHITLVGTTLAHELAAEAGPNVKGYIYDAESIDQLADIARITGSKYIEKSSLGHTLNIRSAVRKTTEGLGLDIHNSHFIVAHIGSGNTIAAVKDFQIIDQVGDDEGPFSSERAGAQSLRPVIDLCYKKSREEVSRILRSEGGLYSHLGTNDGREIEKRIKEGDSYAALVYEALAYQVAKACAELTVPLLGKVDNIIITGGLAHSDLLVEWIEKWAGYIAPIVRHPGEHEMEALANGAYRVTVGEEQSQIFTTNKTKEAIK